MAIRGRRAPRVAAAAFAGALLLVACTRAGTISGSTSGISSATAGPIADAITTSVVKLVRAPHSLPAPVERAAAAQYGAKTLIAGGLDAAGNSTDGVFSFSPSTGKLASLGTLPVPFHDAAGALLGNSLFVFGGGQTATTDTVQAFDLRSNKGSVVGHLPTPLSDLASATIGSTAYLVGGWNGTTPRADVWSTNDGTTFTKVATLPQGVRYPAVAAVGQQLVVAGGLLGSGHETSTVSLVDPSSGTVTKLPSLPKAVGHAMAFTLGSTVYVAGGQDDIGNTLRSVTAINLTAAKADTAVEPMPVPISDAAVVNTANAPALLLGGTSFGSTVATVLQSQESMVTVTPSPSDPTSRADASKAGSKADRQRRSCGTSPQLPRRDRSAGCCSSPTAVTTGCSS